MTYYLPLILISDEQAANFGVWVARTVRRILRCPKNFRFRVLTKDGRWRDEEASGYGRGDARQALQERHDQIEEIIDL